MIEEKQGFIKLYRDLLSWEWYQDTVVRDLFIHCLLKANYKAKKWQGIVIERGQFVTSYPKLALELNFTTRQIRTALKKLKMTGSIAHKGQAKYSIITVLQYDKWQASGRQEGSQVTDKGQASGRQRAATKEIKNIRNKEIKNSINSESENKKIDPFIKNPLVEKFKKEYKKHFGKNCYLNNLQTQKIIEIFSNSEISEQMETIINKFAHILFDTGTRPSLNWLLIQENYTGVLNGDYDQYMQMSYSEIKQMQTKFEADRQKEKEPQEQKPKEQEQKKVTPPLRVVTDEEIKQHKIEEDKKIQESLKKMKVIAGRVKQQKIERELKRF